MIYIILVLGLIIRLISLNQSLWLDEGINVLATQKFSLLGMITEYAKADFHPPGFFFILWIWTHIFGTGEVFVRLPSVIFGVLTIYVIYLIGKKIHSETLGIVSALILTTNPLHIYYSQEARMYALATLAVLINFYLFIKLIKKENLSVFIMVISNLSILFSDYVAYFAFFSQLLFLLVNRDKQIIKFWFKAILISLLASIWWIPIFITQLNIGSVASANLPTWKFVVGGFDIKSTALTLIKFIIGRISLANKLLYYSILLPICLFFLLLLFKGTVSLKGKFSKLLIIWLITPIVLVTIVSFWIPIFSYFRLLFILPAFIILAALGIISYRLRLRYLFLGIILLIQTFSSSVYLFNQSYQREDWRGLVSYLKKNYSKTLILFESSGTLPPFDYYAKDELDAKGALKDFPAKSENDLIDLQGQKELFLVDYLVDISDPDRLVRKKLNDSGYILSETKDFNGVGFVYHYVK